MSIIYKLLNVTIPNYDIMEQLFRAGRSANAVQKVMSGLGIGYRRATVQAVRRDVMDLLVKEDRLAAIPMDRVPNKSQIADGLWEKDQPYKIFGHLTRTNTDTGEEEEVAFSHYFSVLGSKQKLLESFEDKLESTDYGNPFAFTNITIQQVLHNKGASW